MASSRAASAEARAQCDVNCRRFSAGHIALRSASAVEFVEPSSASSFASSSSSSPSARSRSSALQRLKRALFRLRTVAPMESTEKQRKEEEEEEKEQETPFFVNRRKQQRRRNLLAPQPVCPHGNPCRKSQSGGGSGRSSPDSGYDATEPAREAWAETNDMSGGRCEVCKGAPTWSFPFVVSASPLLLCLFVSVAIDGGTVCVCVKGATLVVNNSWGQCRRKNVLNGDSQFFRFFSAYHAFLCFLALSLSKPHSSRFCCVPPFHSQKRANYKRALHLWHQPTPPSPTLSLCRHRSGRCTLPLWKEMCGCCGSCWPAMPSLSISLMQRASRLLCSRSWPVTQRLVFVLFNAVVRNHAD